MSETPSTLDDFTYVAAEIFRHVPGGKNYAYYDLTDGQPDPMAVYKHTGTVITPKDIQRTPHPNFFKELMGKEIFYLALKQPRRVPLQFDTGDGTATLTQIVAQTWGNVPHALVDLPTWTAFVDNSATPYFTSLGFTCRPAEELYTVPMSSAEGQMIMEAMLTGTPVFGYRSEGGIRTSSGNFYPAGV